MTLESQGPRLPLKDPDMEAEDGGWSQGARGLCFLPLSVLTLPPSGQDKPGAGKRAPPSLPLSSSPGGPAPPPQKTLMGRSY